MRCDAIDYLYHQTSDEIFDEKRLGVYHLNLEYRTLHNRTLLRELDDISYIENKKKICRGSRFHKLPFTIVIPRETLGNVSCRSGRSRIWTLWYRSYRSYSAAGKLCYRLCQRVSVPRCTLRRHYARFICLVTFLLFYMSCDPIGAHGRLPLYPSGTPSAVPVLLSTPGSPSVSVAWIRAENRNSNAGIMGRFRLETSSGNSPSAGYCSATDWSSFGNGDAIESATFPDAWLKSGCNACFKGCLRRSSEEPCILHFSVHEIGRRDRCRLINGDDSRVKFGFSE